MKHLLTAILFISLFACTKEEQRCQSCTVVVANGEGYNYKVSFGAWPGSPAPFTLKPGETKTFNAPSNYAVTIYGDFQSPYAHNDFKQSFFCPGDCGPVSVVLKQ